MTDRLAEIAAREAADREILRAASNNSDDWDDNTWAAWNRIADRAHRLKAEVREAHERLTHAQLTELRTKLAIVERQNAELDAEVSRLRKENAEYEKCFVPDGGRS